jgi:anti-sigma factor RsiW
MAQLVSLKAALSSAGAAVELLPDLEVQLRTDLRAVARGGRAARGGIFALVLAVSAAGALWIARAPPPLAAPGERLDGAPTSAGVATAMQRHRLELPVDVASPDPRPVQEFLAARLGHRLRVPRLDGIGFGLQGGRVVDVDNRPGALLVYSGGYGQRLSVVAVPDPDGALAARVSVADASGGDDELRFRVVSGYGAVYTIVGDVDDARLDRVSIALVR